MRSFVLTLLLAALTLSTLLALSAAFEIRRHKEERAMNILLCEGGVSVVIQQSEGDRHVCAYGSLRQAMKKR